MDNDDIAARDNMSDKRIGVIQAEVRRGIYVGPGTDSSGTELSTEPIHETSKKLGSHRVG